ncbi:hypothetical protein KI387_013987, partial [Taxus chinensis]
ASTLTSIYLSRATVVLGLVPGLLTTSAPLLPVMVPLVVAYGRGGNLGLSLGCGWCCCWYGYLYTYTCAWGGAAT